MVRVVMLNADKMLDLRGLILVALAGAWLIGTILDAFLPLPAWILLITAGITLLSIWLLRRDRLGMLVMALLLCAVLGAWRYTIALPGQDLQAISAFIGNASLDILGEVVDEPKLQGWGSSRLLIVAVHRVSENGGASWRDVHGQLEVVVRGSAIEDPYGANYGDQVELFGKVQAATPHSPPGIFASMAFPRVTVQATGNSLLASLYHLRVALATLLAQVLPQPEAALLVAILLGLRTPALKPFAQSFNVTGTAHLIVPSGFKVTILSGLVARGTTSLDEWLHRIRKPQERGSLAATRWQRISTWFPTLAILSSIACYTVLSGAGAAAIRAGVMGALLVIAPRLGRIYNVYTALALTALLMCIIDPFTLWDTGFQLSFLGTLGIVLFTPHIQQWLSFIARLPFGEYQ